MSLKPNFKKENLSANVRPLCKVNKKLFVFVSKAFFPHLLELRAQYRFFLGQDRLVIGKI